MAYPGGKAGSGVYQRIINLMPPHDVYIEPFLGGGAVMLLKRPAALNIGVDLDSSPIAAIVKYSHVVFGDTRSRFVRADALGFLARYPFTGSELVYCDPPYLLSARSSCDRDYYGCEMTDVQHRDLLRLLRRLPCRIMISGYGSHLYDKLLAGWNSVTFQARTRRGTATEWLWYNFPTPVVLHDYRYLGENFRERERINRQKRRWIARLTGMPILQRQALLSAIAALDVSGDPEPSPHSAVDASRV